MEHEKANTDIFYLHPLYNSMSKILHIIGLLLLNAMLDSLVCAYVDPREHVAENKYTGQEDDTVIVGIGFPSPSLEGGSLSSITTSRLGLPDPVAGSCGTPAFTLMEKYA